MVIAFNAIQSKFKNFTKCMLQSLSSALVAHGYNTSSQLLQGNTYYVRSYLLPPINRSTGKLVKSGIKGLAGHQEAIFRMSKSPVSGGGRGGYAGQGAVPQARVF